MSAPTWRDAPEPDHPPLRARDWLHLAVKGTAVGTVVFGGLIILLLIRLIERPIWGAARPITPFITVFVCRTALWLMGLRYRRTGVPMPQHGAMVANHSSWLDIFSLNAAVPVYFVSKSEVANWPGIGWLARATGTVFIERDRSKAREHADILESRLLAGHRLVFFPEGTSTDGRSVIPFKTTLFAPFLTDHLKSDIWVQPVSVIYHAPPGAPARFYGWWGDMAFGPHLLHTLAARQHGAVHVVYHSPLKVSDFDNRKALAAAAEAAVRLGHESHLQ